MLFVSWFVLIAGIDFSDLWDRDLAGQKKKKKAMNAASFPSIIQVVQNKLWKCIYVIARRQDFPGLPRINHKVPSLSIQSLNMYQTVGTNTQVADWISRICLQEKKQFFTIGNLIVTRLIYVNTAICWPHRFILKFARFWPGSQRHATGLSPFWMTGFLSQFPTFRRLWNLNVHKAWFLFFFAQHRQI